MNIQPLPSNHFNPIQFKVHSYIKSMVETLCHFYIIKNHDMFHDVSLCHTKIYSLYSSGTINNNHPT